MSQDRTEPQGERDEAYIVKSSRLYPAGEGRVSGFNITYGPYTKFIRNDAWFMVEARVRRLKRVVRRRGLRAIKRQEHLAHITKGEPR